ncbi:hypothetical protein CONLIGDRAFT_692010 [Coniochaeta ligniaria NRRL 30616]|uniref:Uncharacterized protein n=1 Tax=Coniochaeta ligniaria NRRL 30616 TaxID=1408157 RepID=A0A1J7IBA6_9PEZI|nr:hypothetical protein CONLIGDRAFT_692010 [Coniochaeta ligniaria NRRL 30616]
MSYEEPRDQDNDEGHPPPPYPGSDTKQSPLDSGQDGNVQHRTKTASSGSSSKRKHNLWQRLCDIFTGPASSSHNTRDIGPQAKRDYTHTHIKSPNRQWTGQRRDKCKICHEICGKPHVPPPRRPAGWTRPELQLGHSVNSLHFPREHQSEDTWKDSPWWAYLDVSVTKSEILSQPFPWRQCADRCYEDNLTIQRDELQPGRLMYERKISWGLQVFDGTDFLEDRRFSVGICSKDAQWLADLSRNDLSSFISLESAVRITGWTYSSDDPLQDCRLSYVKHLKPWHMPEPWNGGRLQMDDPELRRTVDQHFEQHLRHPTDAPTKSIDADDCERQL